MSYRDPEKRKQHQRSYREKNKERLRLYDKEYREKNKAKRAAQYRAWLETHRDQKSQFDKSYSRARRERIKERLYAILGDKCVICGFDDKRALQIDHINGGGTKEHKAFPNWENFVRHVINVEGKGYQMLCANCNQIKRRENGEFSNPKWRRQIEDE